MDLSTQTNPGQEFFNPQDNQTYTMKQQIPGQGAVMVNKQTMEESMLPQQDIDKMQQNQNSAQSQQPQPGLKPVMKTTNRRIAMPTENNNVLPEVQDHLKDDIDAAMDEIDQKSQGIEGDIDHILDDAQMFNDVAKESPEDPTDVIKGVNIPGGPDIEAMPKDEIADVQDESKVHPLSDLPKNLLASTRSPLHVKSERKSWKDIRAALTNFGPKTYEERQMVHLSKSGLAPKLAKSLGFSPDKTTVGDSGHSVVNNIPKAAPPKEKDKVIGLTDFPKDQKRDDSVGLDTNKGYNLSMHEMDENQVANREKFDNEKRRLLPNMTIREFRALIEGDGKKERDAIEEGRGLNRERQPVKPEENDNYDIEKNAILQEIGLAAFADIDLDPENEPKPKTPVSLEMGKKKAPPSEAYTEPALIPAAKGKAKEAITKLLDTADQLDTLKADLEAALKPHKDAITRFQQEKNPDIQKKTDLLQSYTNMVFNQIELTKEQVVYAGKKVWAALTETKTSKPAVTVAQIIDEALKINEDLANQIKQIKEKLESAQGGDFEKRRLYQFDVNKATEPKLAPPESSLRSVASLESSIVATMAEFLHGLAQVNVELDNLLDLLGE